MDGMGGGEAGWGDDSEDEEEKSTGEEEDEEEDSGQKREATAKRRTRVGRWESGKGRCAITGRRVLGGTDGLRRVMV